MSNILGVIPARYASTRFPGKPLIDIQGKSMIQRVYEQAIKAELLEDVWIATDDQRIYDSVQNFGGKAVMTSPEIPSGTERVAAVAREFSSYSHYINIQGDEPFIDPVQIDQVASLLLESSQVEIATLVKPIEEAHILQDPKYAKVVISSDGYAIYFSRSPIPYCRAAESIDHWLEYATYYKHISVYGFQKEVLLKIPTLPQVDAEKTESLEQLRWLGNGIKVRVGITQEETLSIDTPQDLALLQQFKENQPGKE